MAKSDIEKLKERVKELLGKNRDLAKRLFNKDKEVFHEYTIKQAYADRVVTAEETAIKAVAELHFYKERVKDLEKRLAGFDRISSIAMTGDGEIVGIKYANGDVVEKNPDRPVPMIELRPSTFDPQHVREANERNRDARQRHQK